MHHLPDSAVIDSSCRNYAGFNSDSPDSAMRVPDADLRP